jgi:type IV pilus assembly protein PilM
MTSTLIDDIDARLKAGVRALLKKQTVAAGIDTGSTSTQVALVGTQGGRAVVHSLVDERGGTSERAAELTNARADFRACGLCGYEVRTFLLDLPPMPKGELDVVIRRSIAQNLQTEREVAFETAPGENGRVEVLAVASPRERISSTFSSLAESGVAADAAYADVTALAECVKAAYPEVENRVTCVCNMGATWSELVLLDRGRLVFSRSIKMGLNNLIETIADLCSVSADEAREMIFSIGTAVSFQEAEEDDLMARTYAESVRDVIEQLVVEVHRSLSFASVRHGLPSPDVILLCGGASRVPGMADALERDTGIAVEIFDPLTYLPKGDDVDSSVNGSLFCVAIGLALLALRPGAPAFLTPGRHMRSGIEERVTTAVAIAAIGLMAVLVTGRVLSSNADHYAEVVGTENLVLASISNLHAEGTTDADPTSQARSYAYSLVHETSPAWGDILRELSTVIPEGIVLSRLDFNRAAMPAGEHSEWEIWVTGVVTDTDNTVALLKQMERALEASGLFRDVEVLPQGATAFTYRGEEIAVAIHFELGARLE